MRKTLSIVTILALATGVATTTLAKSERKEEPKRRFVEDTLKPLGETHFPAKMKVKKISSVEVGDTYYHIFQGKLNKIGYHIIVFDNHLHYLGFYKSNFPPSNDERKGSIVIDSGDVDEDDQPLLYYIPISEKKGLPPKVQIGGMPTSFVKPPKVAAAPKKTTGEGGVVPEYRDWIITYKGKKIPARAIYVKQAAGKVILKLEANGKEKGFPLSSLSREDQAYVKQFK